ncbi:MAG: hypothetical protein AMS26_16050 [Bacteroides sp. SM23_62]|nr:MAG: hypothetical protein AMS26_16050 [Bacteroides sp. SM23_62]
MKNTYSQLILSLLLSFAVLSFADGQKKAIVKRADRLIETSDFITVKGKVITANDYHVKNAEVISRKTGSKGCTDSLGMFEIMAVSGDVLVFKANGFKKNRRKLSANENDITVNMILVPGEKNEKKAVESGHLNGQEIAYVNKQTNHSLDNYYEFSDLRGLIRATCLGARVTDQGSIRVFIRGRDICSSGLSENNGAAIFVLNGMIVRDVDFLNPRDVRSIRLLRGHEASRMYGSLGANGVLMINTKH